MILLDATLKKQYIAKLQKDNNNDGIIPTGSGITEIGGDDEIGKVSTPDESK